MCIQAFSTHLHCILYYTLAFSSRWNTVLNWLFLFSDHIDKLYLFLVLHPLFLFQVQTNSKLSVHADSDTGIEAVPGGPIN